MRILLDSHIFLWAILDDAKLSPSILEAYENPDNQLYLSVASRWELILKASQGKLALPHPCSTFLADQMSLNGILPLGIEASHLRAFESLPLLHKNPFDRMLISQAQTENMFLATADPVLSEYDVAILR